MSLGTEDMTKLEVRFAMSCRELLNAIEDLEEATGHLTSLGHLDLPEGMFTAKTREETWNLLGLSFREVEERLEAAELRFSAFERVLFRLTAERARRES